MSIDKNTNLTEQTHVSMLIQHTSHCCHKKHCTHACLCQSVYECFISSRC